MAPACTKSDWFRAPRCREQICPQQRHAGPCSRARNRQAVARGLPVRVLDHRVRAGKHQPGVTVVETDQIRRFTPVAVHLDDLAVPVRVPDDVAVNADPVADYRFHPRPPSTRRCVTNTASHVPLAVTTTTAAMNRSLAYPPAGPFGQRVRTMTAMNRPHGR